MLTDKERDELVRRLQEEYATRDDDLEDELCQLLCDCMKALSARPEGGEAWTHGCDVIAQKITLWVDRCPKCGMPKPAAPTGGTPHLIADSVSERTKERAFEWLRELALTGHARAKVALDEWHRCRELAASRRAAEGRAKDAQTGGTLSKREIDLIRVCLDDGTYTAQEKKDFGLLCDMAESSLLYPEIEVGKSFPMRRVADQSSMFEVKARTRAGTSSTTREGSAETLSERGTEAPQESEQPVKRWRIKDEVGDDLIAVWKRRPRHSDEYMAAEFLEECERELAASRRAAEGRAQWVSVKERLPKDNEVVIVAGGIAYIRGGDGWYSLTAAEYPGRPIQWEVTHWMPLPAAPAMAEAQGGGESSPSDIEGKA